MTKLDFCRGCGGKLDNQLIDGRVRRVCESCGMVSYENPIPATAAVVRNEAGGVLLVLRNRPPHTGQWCLPGGFLEVDESAEAGCLRELREETGLIGEVSDLIGIELGDNPQYRSVLVIGYTVIVSGGKLAAGDDSDEARFFALESLPPVAFRSHRQILKSALGPELGEAPPSVSSRSRIPRGAYVITSGDHVHVATLACRAGAGTVQFREKSASLRKMLQTARELRRITRQAGALLVVNDCIDLALLCRADGVHLGQDDLCVADARKILPPEMRVGVSTHSLEQALAAEAAGADYIGIGPVFGTPTKADYPPIGLDVVRQVTTRVAIPTVGIGGINSGNLDQVAATGVSNVAMVRAFRQNPTGMVERVNRLFSLSGK